MAKGRESDVLEARRAGGGGGGGGCGEGMTGE